MQTIQKENSIFYVDVEKTREYYLSNTLCDCSGCRNLYIQIETISEKLVDFLSEFGIDICRPDESANVEMNNYIDYLFIGYTVVGRIETEGVYETDIEDLHIKISKGDTPDDWFPNEQKEPSFFVSVTGVSLPWILEEPFPRTENFIDRVKSFLKRK